MYAARTKRLWTTGLAGALLYLGPQTLFTANTHAAPKPDTTVDELFMYGIDADTFELLRYELLTDTFASVGVVVDQNNNTVRDVEALAFVPAGPYRGFYGMTNYNDTQPTKMVKINALDATAWEYDLPVGFWKVSGLVAFQDPGDGEWSLIGATKHTGEADFAAKLIQVDLETGLATELMDLGIMMMAGLAMDARGKLYGVDRGLDLAGEVPPGTQSDLYEIKPWDSPQELKHLGPLPWNKVEAMAFAMGDFKAKIDASAIPGVNTSWTTHGALLGFSDEFDMLMIIDPKNGDAVPYPGTFTTVDCEGLVFVTMRTDPLYGAFRGFD